MCVFCEQLLQATFHLFNTTGLGFNINLLYFPNFLSKFIFKVNESMILEQHIYIYSEINLSTCNYEIDLQQQNVLFYLSNE